MMRAEAEQPQDHKIRRRRPGGPEGVESEPVATTAHLRALVGQPFKGRASSDCGQQALTPVFLAVAAQPRTRTLGCLAVSES